jgi:hypothetical protein
MEKIAIVVQGPSSYVSQIKKWYTGYPLIFSTWVGEEKNYDLEKDIVVFNHKPLDPGPANFWMQQHSTIQGLYKAKELGYTHVLKMRSDMVPTNINRFMLNFDKDAINFLCWHDNPVVPPWTGYFVDYFMFGPINEIITLWDIKEVFCTVPEIHITNQYISYLKDKLSFRYVLNSLNSENDIYWLKRNIYVSSYNEHDCYTQSKNGIQQSCLTS